KSCSFFGLQVHIGESDDGRRPCKARGASSAPSEVRSRQGRVCLCGTTSQVEREAQIFERNATAFRERRRGSRTELKRGPLPLGSLSPCLPVTLSRACATARACAT